MESLLGTGTGSPLQARASAPVFLIIMSLLTLAAVIALLFLVSQLITRYRKSERYLLRLQTRATKKRDVKMLRKKQGFNQKEAGIIWKACHESGFPNILYNLKKIEDVDSLFRQAYGKLKASDYFSDESLDAFFGIAYKLELMVAQRKPITSTRQIPLSRKVKYLTEHGEQYALTVIENNKESMTLEIPDFINESKEKPKPLVQSRFTYKTEDGLVYNFIARVIRYNTVEKDDRIQHTVIVSHSEHLASQTHRHSKRAYTEEPCTFSALKLGEDKESGNLVEIHSENVYKGILSNISAGGCCIHTSIPIKERQNISVSVANYDIWKIPGVIKKTRKLPGGKFALHIQFTQLPLATKNKIQSKIYKFE